MDLAAGESTDKSIIKQGTHPVCLSMDSFFHHLFNKNDSSYVAMSCRVQQQRKVTFLCGCSRHRFAQEFCKLLVVEFRAELESTRANIFTKE